MPDPPRDARSGGREKQEDQPDMATTNLHLTNPPQLPPLHDAGMATPPQRGQALPMPRDRTLSTSTASSKTITGDRAPAAKLPSIHALLADPVESVTQDRYRQSRPPAGPISEQAPMHPPIGYQQNPPGSYGGAAPAVLAPLEPNPQTMGQFSTPSSYPQPTHFHQVSQLPPSISNRPTYGSPAAPHAQPYFAHPQGPAMADPAMSGPLQPQQPLESPLQAQQPIQTAPVSYGQPSLDPQLATHASAPAPPARIPPSQMSGLSMAPPYSLPPPPTTSSTAPANLAPVAVIGAPVPQGPPSPHNTMQYTSGPISNTASGSVDPTHNTFPNVGSNTDRYTCDVCRKSFSRPSSLRIHMHSHTGEKPYICSKSGCGKAFSVRSNMKRHERGCHAGESGHGSSQLNGDSGSTTSRGEGYDGMDGVEEEEDDEEEAMDMAGSPGRNRRARS